MRNAYVKGVPEIVRFSNAVRVLRKIGENDAAIILETQKELQSPICPDHGKLEDPCLFIASKTQVALACPWCSDPTILAKWEREGNVS